MWRLTLSCELLVSTLLGLLSFFGVTYSQK
jgi:hypothetical protein